MSSLDLTRDWLQTVLRPYPAKDRISAEVLNVLKTYRSLAVKTDAFTFDTGHTALLLLLHGTIPINFRGATYHIPLHVWVPHDYPRAPPLSFVVPTKDMGVRKGREVDPSGRVKEEVVEQWWTSWPDKSIEMLLRQLSSVFSAAPPVFAKPPDQTSSPAGPSSRPTPASPIQDAPRAQPPPPPSRPGFGPPPIQTDVLPQYRPAPLPPAGAHPHSRQASLQYAQSPISPSNTGHPASPHSPPIPARPQRGPSPLTPGSQSPIGPAVPQRPQVHAPQPGFGGGSFDRQPPPQPMTPPRPAQVRSVPVPGGPPTQPPWNHEPQYAPQPQYPPNGYASSPTPPMQPQQQPPPHTASLRTHANRPSQPQLVPPQPRRAVQDLMSSPEQPTASLPETADPGAPPPIPPSKPPPPSLLHLHSILLPHLNASLPPLIQSLQANRTHLLERREDLNSGEPAIRDEMARLEAVKKVCDSVGRKMDDVVARGEERVAELEQKGEVSVDEVVCGISIVHNQLIDLVAEDNAIEDTIYHMTRALDSERIDLDRFLKSIRSLAREQYMKRALIERILHGMGQSQGW